MKHSGGFLADQWCGRYIAMLGTANVWWKCEHQTKEEFWMDNEILYLPCKVDDEFRKKKIKQEKKKGSWFFFVSYYAVLRLLCL